MTESQATASADTLATQKIREQLAEEPRWKKILLVLAILFIVAGAVLWFVEGSGGSASGSGAALKSGGAAPEGSASFSGGQITLPNGESESVGEASAEGKWAPVFLRFGFSFFIGYALGFAVRSVLKLTLLFAGLFAMLLFGFGEMGFVEVHWDAMGGAFDGLVEKVKSEAGSVKGLITGRLPSGGLALLGLYAGFRRG